MKEARDKLATKLFGMTKAEAHAKGICWRCRRPVDEEMIHVHPDLDAREYELTGLCPECFDAITEPRDA